jgi:hypothetical protein
MSSETSRAATQRFITMDVLLMQNCIVADDADGRVVVAGAQCKHTAERCQVETASVDISTVVRAGNRGEDVSEMRSSGKPRSICA